MLQNYTTYKILKVFFYSPSKRFGLKEISSNSCIAHTSVKKELKKLIKQGLIKKEVQIKGKRKFPLYFANVNDKFKFLKKISNEYQIRNSGLIEYLVSELMPNTIVLFGSFSKGEDAEESDIDIFVEAGIKEINLKKFERNFKKKINITFKQDINNLKREFLNNVINGIILYGDLRLK